MFSPNEVYVGVQNNSQFVSATANVQNVSASSSQSGLATVHAQIAQSVSFALAQISVIAAGAQGPAGATGSGDLNFIYAQAIPSATWVIVHNLGKHPSVTVVDSAGTWVIGDVHYDSINQCTLTFVGGFSGFAYLN